ncbi:MAG: dTMP kinase [Clostridia bacterium]|nr:dTMP kinase [Clostridia bacterium]
MRKCVIFDLDGTLTRSEEGIWNCVRYAAEKLGFPEPDAPTLRKFIGPPLGYSFREYMGMDDEMADKAVVAYRERYNVVGLFENRVFPGIRRLLRTLKREGWYIGVATGKPQRASERIIEHFGLDKFITKICGPVGDHRPDKIDLIRNALPEGWNADMDDIWMVGDRKFDVEGAIGAGVKSIGVGYGYGSEEELRESGCTQYCETVQDVIDFLCPGAAIPAGAFLSVEGLDGSGKGTQIRLLSDVIDRYGFELQLSREPGGCPISEKLRDIILDRNNADMDDVTEVLLYAAARAQHVRQVIRPAVAAGRVLLCDRYVDSSVAYQGGGRQLGVQRVLDINAPAVDGTTPMATVYLDVDHETSMKRRAAATELDRLELAGDSFHARTEAGYRELIRRDPERFIVVDATRAPEEIGKEIAEKVIGRLMEAE